MKRSKFLSRTLGCLFFIIVTAAAVVIYLNIKWEETNNYVNHLKEPHELDDISLDNRKPKQFRQTLFSGKKIVHIDLKGAPPKVSYFVKVFPIFAQMGVNGLLLEYEDMFPYKGILEAIPALNAYTMDDVKKINSLAQENNLVIIPLIQTFGHMEFILKLSQYRHLREVDQYPQSICPSNNITHSLLTEMIEQVLDAHPKSKEIHIGCDEVFHIAVCERCFNTLVKHKWTKYQLFLNHVVTVSNIVRKKRQNLTVFMWDDVLREIDVFELESSRISDYVVPVVWKYKKNVYEDLGPLLWEKYLQVFKKLWIASAFKGATQSNEFLTDGLNYVENHRSWMNVVSDYKNKVSFEGIFITGWQRYDHFAVLCELLPVAFPSLAMCMRQLSGHYDSLMSPPTEVAKLLNCEKPFALMGPAFGNPKCDYPGSGILEGAINLKRIKDEYGEILEDSKVKGWMSKFNLKYNFSNPELVEAATRQLGRMKIELDQIQSSIGHAMMDIYDNYTIKEWSDTFIIPLKNNIISLWKSRETLLSPNVWPRRPINFNDT